MSLKPVGSAGEENCQAIAVRLGWELSRLGLATLGGGGRRCYAKRRRVLDRMRRLRGRKKTVGDVVLPDGEGGMSVVDGFKASYFRKKMLSCCNLHISA
jgi:hypothetical protein